MRHPQNVLMASPEGFDVRYAINPHMRDASGAMNRIDRALAVKQWEDVKRAYESIGLTVSVLPSHADYPDLVFCANQTFPFPGQDGRPAVLLSRMFAEQRRGEVALLAEWCRARGMAVHEFVGDGFVEGCGDLIWNYATEKVYAGYGFRTSREAVAVVREIVPYPVIALELVDERFYHLDTCFSVLDGETAVYVDEAFSCEALEILKKDFKRLLKLDFEEALHGFSANCHCPDGRNVIVQKGCVKFNQQVRALGFNVIEVETSEFIKSGGSVFCMKQMFF